MHKIFAYLMYVVYFICSHYKIPEHTCLLFSTELEVLREEKEVVMYKNYSSFFL